MNNTLIHWHRASLTSCRLILLPPLFRFVICGIDACLLGEINSGGVRVVRRIDSVHLSHALLSVSRILHESYAYLAILRVHEWLTELQEDDLQVHDERIRGHRQHVDLHAGAFPVEIDGACEVLEDRFPCIRRCAHQRIEHLEERALTMPTVSLRISEDL